MKRALARLIGLSASLAALACGSSAPIVPTVIARVRDVRTDITVGASDSILVKVSDASGNPASGTTVSFSVADGGTLSAPSAVTGANGVAGVLWTLGRLAGPQSASASSGTLGRVTFGAEARAGPAASLTKIGSDPVNPPSGINVDSIGVLVSDSFGNPRGGVQVTFAATAGGGSVSPTTVTTNASGRASARWTLGTTALVVNSASATVTGLPPVTWSATTTMAAATLVLTTPRIMLIDSGTTAAINFEARDGAGNVLAGQPLVAVSRTGAAVYGNGVVSGVKRGQTFIVVSSELNAAAVDSVLVIVAVPGAPVLRTDIVRTDFGTAQTLVVTILLDMRTSLARLGAATTLVTWNPAQLTYVSDAEGSAPIGAIVNAASASSGSLALTMASSSGFAGQVQLRKITFRTAAPTGVTGALVMLPTEIRAAGSFNDLLLSTVTASYPLILR